MGAGVQLHLVEQAHTVSYADDYEEESWNPGLQHDAYGFNNSLDGLQAQVDDAQESALEQAIDEQFADFTGTGLRHRLDAPIARPITIHHTPQENTMARSKTTIQYEISKTNETIQSLIEHRKRLEKELRETGPAEPSQPRASVRVKFNPDGKEYEFLLMRAPNGYWYTTGSRAEHNMFVNWASLVRWLTSSDVYWFSEITPLVSEQTQLAPF